MEKREGSENGGKRKIIPKKGIKKKKMKGLVQMKIKEH